MFSLLSPQTPSLSEAKGRIIAQKLPTTQYLPLPVHLSIRSLM